MPASTRSARWPPSTSITPFPPPNLRRAINRLLPPAIRILSAAEVDAAFHPRFDAIAKTYEYRILRGETCPPFDWPYVHHYPYPLDEERMATLARAFAGEHDFTAFAAADDRDREGRSKVRTIFSSVLERTAGRLTYRVRGSGFLKHMVRNIAGTLLEAGRGRLAAVDAIPPECGPTLPAKGLFLMGVEYAGAADPLVRSIGVKLRLAAVLGQSGRADRTRGCASADCCGVDPGFARFG